MHVGKHFVPRNISSNFTKICNFNSNFSIVLNIFETQTFCNPPPPPVSTLVLTADKINLKCFYTIPIKENLPYDDSCAGYTGSTPK